MEVILTGWFYLTPIIYPIYLAQDTLQERGMGWAFVVIMINPMTPFVVLYRWIFLAGAFSQPELAPMLLLVYLGIGLCTSLIFYITGRAVFKHYGRKFADEL